jgi:hypothetical protein
MSITQSLSSESVHVHALGTPRHPPALLQAVELAPAVGVGLALHVVIVVVAAPGADEEGSGEKRRRAGTDLLDLGDRIRERGGVVVELLGEAMGASAVHSSIGGRPMAQRGQSGRQRGIGG